MKKSLVLMAFMALMNSAYADDCSHEVVQRISIQIDSYLDIHPNATDTAEGIHHFWIDWGGEPSWPLFVTEKSLSCLESEGKIHHFKIGTKILWRR